MFSDAIGWSNIRYITHEDQMSSPLNIQVKPEYLPDGSEDQTAVIVGMEKIDNQVKDIIKVEIKWFRFLSIEVYPMQAICLLQVGYPLHAIE